MEDTMQDLARRVAACKHWRWLPGMKAVWPDGSALRIVTSTMDDEQSACPDLRDPATIGAFMAVVRRAIGAHVLWLQPGADHIGWGVHVQMPDKAWRRVAIGETGAEALVAALEAA